MFDTTLRKKRLVGLVLLAVLLGLFLWFNRIPKLDTVEADLVSATTSAVQCYNDIWATYTATCTGELTVSTCADLTLTFDTCIAIYENDCSGQPDNIIGCNDLALCSRVTVHVTEGTTYLVNGSDCR